jgi:uncharacterized protein YutE (UPF0331/DUF86 family)
MIDPITIRVILGNLQEYRQKLSRLAAFSEAEFKKEFTRIESAKHLLQVSIQSCIDIAHHIVADGDYRTPNDSFDAFVVLNEVGIIPDTMMPKLRQMVSFRNRVVHLYWAVDDSAIYEILQNNLGDFDTFSRHIIEYIEA